MERVTRAGKRRNTKEGEDVSFPVSNGSKLQKKPEFTQRGRPTERLPGMPKVNKPVKNDHRSPSIKRSRKIVTKDTGSKNNNAQVAVQSKHKQIGLPQQAQP